LVENMAYLLCDHSSKPIKISGHGGGKKLSQELGMPLLGVIPIELQIKEVGDLGVPMMVSGSESDTVRDFQSIERRIMEEYARS
jgi:ATP-binding protein involved in chromosome partitioning